MPRGEPFDDARHPRIDLSRGPPPGKAQKVGQGRAARFRK